MTWVTGVAAGHIDFLDQLQLQLTSRGHAFGLVYSGTGNGALTGTTGVPGGYVGGVASVAETFVITALDANTFSVVGSSAGALADATVDTAYTTDRLAFRINGGVTPFAAGDQFKVSTTPPWSLIRRHGAMPSMRNASGFANSARLWDDSIDSAATAAALPANAGISMIGPADLRRVAITTYTTAAYAPSAFRVEYSDDGSNWSLAQAYTDVVFTFRETRIFAVNDVGQHLHWRVVFTASISGGSAGIVEVAELRFYKGVTGNIELQRRAEWVVSAPGNDGADAIFIGAEVYEDAALAARSLNCYQFRSYDNQVSIRTQASNSGLRNIPLSSNNFTWWLAINGRRFAGVAKIGVVYVPFYQGLGKPYELPSVHPYPAINAGTSNDEAGVSTSVSADFRGFSSPGRYGLVARYPNGSWQVHANRFQQSTDTGDTTTTGKVYPAATDSFGSRANYRELLDGTRPLYEIVLTNTSPQHTWGELDGCYFTPGFNLVPEVVVRMDGFDHLVFQNCFRNAADDFFAIRQD